MRGAGCSLAPDPGHSPSPPTQEPPLGRAVLFRAARKGVDRPSFEEREPRSSRPHHGQRQHVARPPSCSRPREPPGLQQAYSRHQWILPAHPADGGHACHLPGQHGQAVPLHLQERPRGLRLRRHPHLRRAALEGTESRRGVPRRMQPGQIRGRRREPAFLVARPVRHARRFIHHVLCRRGRSVCERRQSRLRSQVGARPRARCFSFLLARMFGRSTARARELPRRSPHPPREEQIRPRPASSCSPRAGAAPAPTRQPRVHPPPLEVRRRCARSHSRGP